MLPACNPHFEKNMTHCRYLDDGGVAEVPLELLVAIEVGLRNTASGDTKCMGKFALTSKEGWMDPDLVWRKVASYRMLYRKIVTKKSRRQWKSETHQGFKLRQRLRNTFLKRHLQFSRSVIELCVSHVLNLCLAHVLKMCVTHAFI